MSNDEVTRLFMAVGNREICIRYNHQFTIVDMVVSTCQQVITAMMAEHF